MIQARWRWPRAGWSPVLLTMVACGHQSQPTAPGGEMLNLDSLPRLSILAVRRFGSEESPDTGFAEVGSVDVDRDGLVYAVDRMDFRIRVYNPSGQLVRIIGRPGQGPGEFGGPPLFGVVGDTVWTYDGRNRRLTLFDRTGGVISTAPVARVEVPVPEHPSMKGILAPVLMRPDGRLLSSVRGYSGGGPPQRGLPDTLTNPEVEWDASGRVVDTVALYAAPHVGSLGDYLTIDGQVYDVPSPPSDRPLRLLLPDGQIVVDRSVATSSAFDSLSVTRTSFSGDTLFHQSFRYRPVGYPPEVLDNLASENAWPALTWAGSGAEPSLEAERAIRAKMEFPAWQPPVQDALVGASGEVWLRREDRAEETYEWVVLAPDGKALGVVGLPRDAVPAWARGDRVLVVHTDSVGVPWVVEHHLRGAK